MSRAERVAFLVDAANYFGALRQALLNARQSVRILAWDIDSSTQLVAGEAGDGHAVTLDALFSQILERNPALRIDILYWSSTLYYAFERERFPLPLTRRRWAHRVRFVRDRSYSPGSSHHQKVVVVDDSVAFCGGIDLTRWRWDTSAHIVGDPRRADRNGVIYPPFHDMAMIVDGLAARTLAELAQRRWARATGEAALPLVDVDHDPWPEFVAPDARDIDVGVARTMAGRCGERGVREIEQLCLDMIYGAKRYIYVEEPFLTATRIERALIERLRQPGGPEIVLVLRHTAPSWLEHRIMGVRRSRLLRHLRHADRYGCLRTYYPQVTGAKGDRQDLNVHSKLLIVDGRLLRLGSANLTNRSLCIDTESDLTIDSYAQPQAAAAVEGLLCRLLGEHLGVAAEHIRETLAQKGSLIATIERWRGGERSLNDLDGTVRERLGGWLPVMPALDPIRPLPLGLLPHAIVAGHGPRAFVAGWAMRVLVLMGLLALLWR